jgi:hypothetical protein
MTSTWFSFRPSPGKSGTPRPSPLEVPPYATSTSSRSSSDARINSYATRPFTPPDVTRPFTPPDSHSYQRERVPRAREDVAGAVTGPHPVHPNDCLDPVTFPALVPTPPVNNVAGYIPMGTVGPQHRAVYSQDSRNAWRKRGGARDKSKSKKGASWWLECYGGAGDNDWFTHPAIASQQPSTTRCGDNDWFTHPAIASQQPSTTRCIISQPRTICTRIPRLKLPSTQQTQSPSTEDPADRTPTPQEPHKTGQLPADFETWGVEARRVWYASPHS